MDQKLVTELVAFLGSLAFYNDKGFEWAGHSSEKVIEERAKAQKEIQILLNKIGEHRFPAPLLEALKNGQVVSDATGTYKNKVEALFSHM